MRSLEHDERSSLLRELPRWYIPRRYIMAVLLHLSILICYVLRVNLSVAAINMAEEYNWTKDTKGVVLSAFFWGYITTQLIGGYVSQKFGGKVTLIFGVGWPALFTCITPFVASNVNMLIVCRVLTGFGEGVLFPTIYSIIGKWLPQQERGRTLAIIWSGSYTGTIIGTVTSPPIIASLGWPWVFYIASFAGLLWLAIWIVIAASEPATSNIIHPAEMLYISCNLESVRTSKSFAAPALPLVDIQTSTKEITSTEALVILGTRAPFWSIVLCNLTFNWGFYVLLTWLPTYYKDQLNFSEFETGLMSVLPYLAMMVFTFAAGIANDALLRKGTKPIIARKMITALAAIIPSIVFVTIALVPLNRDLIASMLAIGIGATGLNSAGYTLNILEIAPAYGCLVAGVSNTAGTIPGIIGVASTGFLLTAFGGSWTAVFLVPVGFYVLGLIVFTIFASSTQIL